MSVLDDIAKLDKLRRDGVITQAEFDAQKARLLSPAAAPAAISGPAAATAPHGGLNIRCGACGEPISAAAKTCPQCGHPVSGAQRAAAIEATYTGTERTGHGFGGAALGFFFSIFGLIGSLIVTMAYR